MKNNFEDIFSTFEENDDVESPVEDIFGNEEDETEDDPLYGIEDDDIPEIPDLEE